MKPVVSIADVADVLTGLQASLSPPPPQTSKQPLQRQHSEASAPHSRVSKLCAALYIAGSSVRELLRDGSDAKSAQAIILGGVLPRLCRRIQQTPEKDIPHVVEVKSVPFTHSIRRHWVWQYLVWSTSMKQSADCCSCLLVGT